MAHALRIRPRPKGPAYQVVSNDPDGLEIRFHGMPLRGVHADDNQNALSIDFQQPVDGAVFDRLSGDAAAMDLHGLCQFRQWRDPQPPPRHLPDPRRDRRLLAAHRAARRAPARNRCRKARAAKPMPHSPRAAAAAAYPPARRLYPAAVYPAAGSPMCRRKPPMPAFTPMANMPRLRAYEAQELAIRRGDPMWQLAYGRAAMQAAPASAFATKPTGIMAATA